MDKKLIAEKIFEHVRDFRVNYQQHRKELERNTETKLVEPLFTILGWTTKDFEKGARARRGMGLGFVDYAFKINNKVVFYLEVKRLGVPLEREADTQVISYALSRRVPIAVSTNFETLKIFCAEEENAVNNVFRVFTKPEDYVEYLDDLLFLHKESFKEKLLLKKAEAEGRLKKRITIDKPLLEDMMRIRNMIANDIEKRYPKKYELNEREEIIQRIMDRLIFIRKCEDVGINPDGLILKEITHHPYGRAYSRLKNIFKQYNDVYNGGLFAIGIDNDCDKITIDGKIVQNLISLLYESKDKQYKYNFDKIDADILGQVYEQYLGKILAQTRSGRSKLKNGQAHRKEQGIYYTPTYIVDYIVNNTLGDMLKNKKIDAKKIKVLDLACGSGSFLIKAFDYLKEDLYQKDEAKLHRIDGQGMYSIKTEIFKNNIYGIDLDVKAVEITKLNLLLKAAEKFRKLPEDSELHIKRGNSLIDDENIVGLDAFKWEGDFQEGSFDVVIGNPPYFNIETISTEEKEALKIYDCYSGKSDILYYFYNKGISLLKPDGKLGFITSRYFIEATYAKKLRKYILQNCEILKIIDLSKLPVFQDVGIHTVILILKKKKNIEKITKNKIQYKEVTTLEQLEDNDYISLEQVNLNEGGWILGTKSDLKILKKIDSRKSTTLGDISIIEQGQKTGLNRAFTVTKEIIREYKLEKKFIRKLVKNSYIGSFFIEDRGLYLIYASNEMNVKNAPNIISYLKSYKDKLKARAEARDGLYPWYRLQRPRAKELFDADEKIIVPYRAEKNKFGYDDEQRFNDGGDVRIIVIQDKNYMVKYILAVLNSTLMNYYYSFIGRKKGMAFEYFVEPLQKIPIVSISLNEQKKFVELTDRMLHLKRRLNDIGDKRTNESVKIEENIEKTKTKIDALVYKIYGLTKNEIKTVEATFQ